MIRRIGLILAATVGLLYLASPSSPSEVQAATAFDAPKRVLDTRNGTGGHSGRVNRNEVIKLRIPGVQVSGDTAVLLNLTAVESDVEGFVSAWPCAESKPDTAALNFAPGRAVPNMAVLKYTSDGICLAASSSVHLVADLTGVTTGGEIRGIAPNRIVDTRNGQPYQAGREYRVKIAGTTGISSSAAGAALNVTVVRPSKVGRVVVKRCGSSSDASTLNYQPGEVVPHLTFTALGSGDVCIMSTTTADVVVDGFAWMPASSKVSMLTPARLLDTRTGKGGTLGAVRDGQLLRLRVAGEGGVPNDADSATINLAAIDVRHRGFVAVWPCNVSQPKVATLNLWNGMRRANQATIKLSPGGELCLRPKIAGSTPINLIVDAVGYVDGNVDRNPPPVTTPPTTPPPTTAPPTTTPPITTPPSSGKFPTLPVGAALPSGAQCAARVRSVPEIRPDNAAANANRGSRANANNRTDWSQFDRVDGDFAGTTDEIIQWAACKWGIDEDIARAQVVKESFWHQSANGDNGESWGLGQVRDTAHQSAFEYSVNARNSSAYNLDYTYATWRACYEGVYTWLNTVERGATYGPGDAWGCTGVWFSGRWYTQAAINYIEGGDTGGYGDIGVKQHYRDRTWETPSFKNG